MPGSLLIADCGATSGKWAFIEGATGTVARFATGPLNPSVYTSGQIEAVLSKAAEHCPLRPDEVHIYAAGAIGDGCNTLADSVACTFGLNPKAVMVESDLTGAARALLGHRSGIACILGTGSNSCLWNGERIVYNMPPMGYILGDEGSGAAIGSAILRCAIRRLFPDLLMQRWERSYPDLTYVSLVQKVYREHAASGYIASFVPFATANINHPFMRELVRNAFSRFFDTILQSYPEALNLSISFTGGVATAFESLLRDTAESYSLNVDTIAANPLDLLVSRALCILR